MWWHWRCGWPTKKTPSAKSATPTDSVVGTVVERKQQFVAHVPGNILATHFRHAEVLKEEKEALRREGYSVSHVDARGIWYVQA